MELYLLDERAERIAIVQEYESLIWSTGLMTSSADLKAPICCFEDMMQATYLERSDSDTILFINRKSITDKVSDKSSYLSAYDPVELLRRRVLWWTHSFNNRRREDIIVSLANAGLVTVTTRPPAQMAGRNRQIPLFANMMNTNTSGLLSDLLTQQMSWGTIYEHIEDMLEGLPIRFYSSLARGSGGLQINPLLYQGADRTKDVVVSSNFGDLFDVEYVSSSVEKADLAVIAGQGEDADRVVEATARQADFAVPYGELWVDANDVGDNDGELTAAQVRTALRSRGIEELHKQPNEHALIATISQARFQYGADYHVGDRISYEAFGARHNDVVSKVEEVFEGQHSRINITIGTAYPTIRKIIERNRK